MAGDVQLVLFIVRNNDNARHPFRRGLRTRRNLAVESTERSNLKVQLGKRDKSRDYDHMCDSRVLVSSSSKPGVQSILYDYIYSKEPILVEDVTRGSIGTSAPSAFSCLPSV